MSADSHNIILILLIIIILLLVFLITFFFVIFISKYYRSKAVNPNHRLEKRFFRTLKRHPKAQTNFEENISKKFIKPKSPPKRDYFETVDLRNTTNDSDFEILSDSTASDDSFNDDTTPDDNDNFVRDFKKHLHHVKKNMEK
ncbi:hypothetical protein [Mycoplasma sp. SG1]|uniref:hypothetical protein n=1 Tax=Mycoplasma sp. SG1 TaxID=2810348 RepID=UPI002024D0CD|nr:hypothetical protein [Mycoplasma sp. SG1]URM53098.1 hypothetical protein JRW51_01990 [Mycoplasma sp. SG1]